MQFENRIDAGRQLAKALNVANPENSVILALPRGGVPLGIILADTIGCPLDVILAKKIVHPLHSEFAIGALTENGELLLNTEIQVEDDWIKQETERINQENKHRRKLYGPHITKQELTGKDIIIVDDGIATGMTMFAAIKGVKAEQPNSITVAVPIIPKDTYPELKEQADSVLFVEVPEHFIGAVGAYYQNFPQITDEEVLDML